MPFPLDREHRISREVSKDMPVKADASIPILLSDLPSRALRENYMNLDLQTAQDCTGLHSKVVFSKDFMAEQKW